jgi:hypothetical protein
VGVVGDREWNRRKNSDMNSQSKRETEDRAGARGLLLHLDFVSDWPWLLLFEKYGRDDCTFSSQEAYILLLLQS